MGRDYDREIFGERSYTPQSNFKYKVAAVVTALAVGYVGFPEQIQSFFSPIISGKTGALSSSFGPSTVQDEDGFNPSDDKIFGLPEEYKETLKRVKSIPFYSRPPSKKIKNELYRFSHSYFPAPKFETDNKGDENSMSLAILLNGLVIPPGEHQLFGELLAMNAADFDSPIDYVDGEGEEKQISFNKLGGGYAIGSEACYEYNNFVYTIDQLNEEKGVDLTMRAAPHTDPYGFHYYDPDGLGPKIAYSFLIPGGDGTLINNTDTSIRVHTFWDKETGENSIILEEL